MNASDTNPFERDLDKRPTNYVPLSPVSFLARAASFFGGRPAVIHGERTYSYAEFYARCRRLASALAARGVGRLDTVACLAANGPPLLEVHFGVPMIGAVLNPLNTRLDAASIAFCLDHGEAKVLIVDREFSDTVSRALDRVERDLLVVDIDDPLGEGGQLIGALDYEALLCEGDPAFDYPGAGDEWQSLSLLYTSGTTGDPKGAVYCHRGAYLAAIGNALTFGLGPDSIYLWTLPMFHCDGWSFPWAVTAVGGTHVCLRKIDTAQIFELIRRHRVTHMCGAPIVLNMLVHAPDAHKIAFDHTVRCATGGAAPPSTIIQAMETLGFQVTHLYGTTECYGPSTVCIAHPEWAGLEADRRYANMARQGVSLPMVEGCRVADPDTLLPVPRDGQTVGEIMLRGNTLAKGYLKNPASTEKAFAGGWYRTGDLAVWDADGSIAIKDRSKDVIISGGENISSLEVEEILFRHPAVMEAAVVARPDEKWGETPCAFVTLKPGAERTTKEDIIAFCRDNMAHYKAPRTIVFAELPKTSTGKIQKFVLREWAKSV